LDQRRRPETFLTAIMNGLLLTEQDDQTLAAGDAGVEL
jgi:hypothetical protein